MCYTQWETINLNRRLVGIEHTPLYYSRLWYCNLPTSTGFHGGVTDTIGNPPFPLSWRAYL